MPDLPPPRLTFVLGGARSGKSAHGEQLISRLPAPWIYIATAQAFDAEMETRIRQHQDRRDERWQTVEAPLELVKTLDKVPDNTPLLLDCLTLWLSNQLLREADLDHETNALIAALARPRGPWVIVSNETGMGIVPDNALARRFRDEAGRLNQRVAAMASEVILMTAGIPLHVKQEETTEI